MREHDGDDCGHRDGVDEKQPCAEVDAHDDKGAENNGGDGEHRRDRQQQHKQVIVRLVLLGRDDLADEVADCHTVERGNLRKDAHVGQALAALPFGDRFVGVVELLRQIELRIAVRLAVSCDIFGDGSPDGCFVCEQADFPLPNVQKECDSTDGRVQFSRKSPAGPRR